MPIPEIAEDEGSHDKPATPLAFPAASSGGFVPVGRYTAAVLMKLEQRLPSIRCERREAPAPNPQERNC